MTKVVDGVPDKTREHDAVLRCLAGSSVPLNVQAILSQFAKAGLESEKAQQEEPLEAPDPRFPDAKVNRRFEPAQLEALLKELLSWGYAEVDRGLYRATSEGKSALGPLAERPLAEI